MAKNISLLVASRSSTRLNSIEDAFFDAQGIALSRKLINDRTLDLLSDISDPPDVILLDLGEQWEAELTTLANSSTVESPPLVVLGSADVPQMMRRSMQAGARDFFVSPIDEDELIATVRRIGTESQMSRRQNLGKITVVMNGKGGSGSTVITTALAALLTGTKKDLKSVAAVDADLQFGAMPVYFDLPAKDNLMNALQVSETLDPVALEGFLERHQSGIGVLSSQAEDVRDMAGLNTNSVTQLFNALITTHDHVVVDTPRRFDSMTSGVIEMADQVFIVTQQTVPHVRDTRYLLGLIRLLGVPSNRVCVLVNRFERRGEISVRDIADALEDVEVYTVGNDYKRVSSAINNGVLVPIAHPKSRFTKDMVKFIQKRFKESG